MPACCPGTQILTPNQHGNPKRGYQRIRLQLRMPLHTKKVTLKQNTNATLCKPQRAAQIHTGVREESRHPLEPFMIQEPHAARPKTKRQETGKERLMSDLVSGYCMVQRKKIEHK